MFLKLVFPTLDPTRSPSADSSQEPSNLPSKEVPNRSDLFFFISLFELKFVFERLVYFEPKPAGICLFLTEVVAREKKWEGS